MTRAELMELIKPLKWKRTGWGLRCAKGDCPIIAAAKLRGVIYSNVEWPSAARFLGLSYEEAERIAMAADSATRRIPELENGERINAQV